MITTILLLVVTAIFGILLLTKGESLFDKLSEDYMKNYNQDKMRTFNPSNVDRSELRL